MPVARLTKPSAVAAGQTVSKLQHTAVRNVTRTFKSGLGGSDRLHQCESQCSDFVVFPLEISTKGGSAGGSEVAVALVGRLCL